MLGVKWYPYLLFFLSPFLGLFYGLKSLNDRGKLIIFSVFGFFYGLLIQYKEGNDAASHAAKIESYTYFGFEEFVHGLRDIFTLTPSVNAPADPYLHFLLGISGSFFSSKIVLFSIVGAIYGYFYGSALLKIIKIPQGQRISLMVFSLIFLFVIHRSFESMQTIRSWTGMWVLFNGVAGYYSTKEKRYILLMLFSSFFHLMYAFISLPALIFLILKRVSPKIIIGIYVLSFAVNVNTLTLVETASQNDLAKSKLASYYRIDQYSGEEFDPIALRQESSNAVWYAKYGKTTSVYTGATYFFFFLIVFGYFSKNKLTELEYGLLGTGILLASLSNFLSFAFALYSRTMANATTYILAVMVLLALRKGFDNTQFSFWKRSLGWVGVIIFIPKIIYFLSDFMYRTSFFLISTPFLGFLGDDFNLSIRDLIDIII